MYIKGNVPRICERCGAAFTTWPGQIRKGKGRFCGKSCSSASRTYPHSKAGRKRTPAEERFWPKVEKTDSCWLWTASRNHEGYGEFKVSPEQTTSSHRYSWELHNGPIPPGMKVLHRCDNPPCCNPSHLFLGTDMDNARDRDRKGRYRKAMLRPEAVIEIRTRRRDGASVDELAADFGLTASGIEGIIRRRTWKDIKIE